MFQFLVLLIMCAISCMAQQGPPLSSAVTPNTIAPGKPSLATANQEFVATDIFHVVGIPTLSRNNRVNLILTDQEMRFEKKSKALLVVPYGRVHSVEVISGERHYGKATYGAAIATPFGLGSLLILKKRNVDTLVLEYTNERGGLMNVVVQFPKNQGVGCGQVMSKHGVEFNEKADAGSAVPGTQSLQKDGKR